MGTRTTDDGQPRMTSHRATIGTGTLYEKSSVVVRLSVVPQRRRRNPLEQPCIDRDPGLLSPAGGWATPLFRTRSSYRIPRSAARDTSALARRARQGASERAWRPLADTAATYLALQPRRLPRLIPAHLSADRRRACQA